jgi:hypothetical protein
MTLALRALKLPHRHGRACPGMTTFLDSYMYKQER